MCVQGYSDVSAVVWSRDMDHKSRKPEVFEWVPQSTRENNHGSFQVPTVEGAHILKPMWTVLPASGGPDQAQPLLQQCGCRRAHSTPLVQGYALGHRYHPSDGRLQGSRCARVCVCARMCMCLCACV